MYRGGGEREKAGVRVRGREGAREGEEERENKDCSILICFGVLVPVPIVEWCFPPIGMREYDRSCHGTTCTVASFTRPSPRADAGGARGGSARSGKEPKGK